MQAPVLSRVRRVDWRRERDEWKREKARPGGDVVIADERWGSEQM